MSYKDPVIFLDEASKLIEKKIKTVRKKLITFKINLNLCCKFVLPKHTENGEMELFEDYKYFTTKSEVITATTNATTVLKNINSHILNKVNKNNILYD